MNFKFLVFFVLIIPGVFSQEKSLVIGDTLTLEKCIQIALENQPAIGTSQGAVITAESEYTQVKSLYFPQAQLEGGMYLTNTALQSPNLIAPSPTVIPKGTNFIPSLRVIVKQPIYDFGRTGQAVDSKNMLIKSAELSLQSTEQDVTQNVKISYYNYLLAQQIVHINEERVTQSKKHLDRAKGFFEVGKLPESEVSKAELEVSNAELELINARGKSRLAKVSLNSAMGITEINDDPQDYTLPSDVAFLPFVANLKDAITQALESRKEVAAADLRIRSAQTAMKAAKSQYYPIVTASGGFGPYVRQENADAPFTQGKLLLGYNVGINLAFPIFQGLSVRADIIEAQGRIRIATSQYNVLKQRIIQEVQERYFSAKYAEERFKATDKIISQGEKNLALAEGRFETGVGSAIEITDANLSLANARIERTTALYNYQMELARFQRSIGKIREN